ncbi:MAG: hypothetical protein HY911_04570 [Desulfobacterales bacterium]|nr:hypothetical protein [Desulfobacterales bacterium]
MKKSILIILIILLCGAAAIVRSDGLVITGTENTITFGHATSAPASTGTSASSFARFVAPASFLARSIWIYSGGSGGTGIIGGVYADSGGTAPGARLETSATGITANTTYGCYNLNSAESIASGTAYWIGWLASETIIYGYTAGTNLRYTTADTYSTLSDPFNGASTTARELGVYLSSEVCP